MGLFRQHRAALAGGLVAAFAGALTACGAAGDPSGPSDAMGAAADARPTSADARTADLRSASPDGDTARDGLTPKVDGPVTAGDLGGLATDASPVLDDLATSPTPDAAPPGPDATTSVNDGCRALVDQGAYVIFAYEASLPDATEVSPGLDDTGLCSRPGVLPRTDVTHAQATAACASVGFTLCSNDQWQAACAGPDGNLFPYGGPHADAACNDHISGGNALEPTGHRPGCRTASGLYDLSGNVWEITAESERRGGSWRVNASTYQAEYAGCYEHVFINDFYADADVGFRCCRAR